MAACSGWLFPMKRGIDFVTPGGARALLSFKLLVAFVLIEGGDAANFCSFDCSLWVFTLEILYLASLLLIRLVTLCYLL